MAPGPAAELAARIALGRAIRADFARLALEDRPDWYVWAHRLGTALNGLLSALDGLEAAPGAAGGTVVTAGDLGTLGAALTDATGYRLARGDDDMVIAYRRLAAAVGICKIHGGEK